MSYSQRPYINKPVGVQKETEHAGVFISQYILLKFSSAFAQFLSDLRRRRITITGGTGTIIPGQSLTGNDQAIIENEDENVGDFSLSLTPPRTPFVLGQF